MQTAWFTSPFRVVTISVINVILTVMALIVMLARQGISERTAAVSLFVLSFMVFMVAGILFTGRAMSKWNIQNLARYVIWERALVIVSTVTTSLGLVLLNDILTIGGDKFLGLLGTTAYLLGAVQVVSAETAFISKSEWNYPQVIVYVILALLGQTAIGVAMLQTGFAAAWVGWLTVIWNVLFLIIFIVLRPRDVYYPVIHFFVPLLIGLILAVRL
ncbi:MAG: hypothetical protein GC179_25595 [Anaerolineaceae bacterium]|nr:hypothetical protein [Anaerolineaceae bacterium]